MMRGHDWHPCPKCGDRWEAKPDTGEFTAIGHTIVLAPKGPTGGAYSVMVPFHPRTVDRHETSAKWACGTFGNLVGYGPDPDRMAKNPSLARTWYWSARQRAAEIILTAYPEAASLVHPDTPPALALTRPI